MGYISSINIFQLISLLVTGKSENLIQRVVMLRQKLRRKQKQRLKPRLRATLKPRRVEGGNENQRETVQMPRQKQRQNLRPKQRRLRVTMISRMQQEGTTIIESDIDTFNSKYKW